MTTWPNAPATVDDHHRAFGQHPCRVLRATALRLVSAPVVKRWRFALTVTLWRSVLFLESWTIPKMVSAPWLVGTSSIYSELMNFPLKCNGFVDFTASHVWLPEVILESKSKQLIGTGIYSMNLSPNGMFYSKTPQEADRVKLSCGQPPCWALGNLTIEALNIFVQRPRLAVVALGFNMRHAWRVLRHHGNAGYRAVLNCLVELECSADSKEKLQGFSASWLEFQAALRLQELNTARSTLLVGCLEWFFKWLNGSSWCLLQSIWEPLSTSGAEGEDSFILPRMKNAAKTRAAKASIAPAAPIGQTRKRRRDGYDGLILVGKRTVRGVS